jgi:hypothetical protein
MLRYVCIKFKGKPYFSKDNAHRFLLKNERSCLLYHIKYIERYNIHVFLIPANDNEEYSEFDFIKTANGSEMKECFLISDYKDEKSIISQLRDTKIKEILE